jgi:hypothetical protein
VRGIGLANKRVCHRTGKCRSRQGAARSDFWQCGIMVQYTVWLRTLIRHLKGTAWLVVSHGLALLNECRAGLHTSVGAARRGQGGTCMFVWQQPMLAARLAGPCVWGRGTCVMSIAGRWSVQCAMCVMIAQFAGCPWGSARQGGGGGLARGWVLGAVYPHLEGGRPRCRWLAVSCLAS